MQINSFAFPLGSGPAATVGAVSALPGFADAMNLALGPVSTLTSPTAFAVAPAAPSGTFATPANPAAMPQGFADATGLASPIVLPAAPVLPRVSAMPAMSASPSLTGTSPLAAAPVLPSNTAPVAAAVLPASTGEAPLLSGLQTPTTLSQLMATAARLPAAEPAAAGLSVPTEEPATPLPGSVSPEASPATPNATLPQLAAGARPAAADADVATVTPANTPAPSPAQPVAAKPSTAATAANPASVASEPAVAQPALAEAVTPESKPQAPEDDAQLQPAPRKGARSTGQRTAAEQPAAQPQVVTAQPATVPLPLAAVPAALQPASTQAAPRSDTKLGGTVQAAGPRAPAMAGPNNSALTSETTATSNFARAVTARGEAQDGGTSNDAAAGQEHQAPIAGKVEGTPSFTLASAATSTTPHAAPAPASEPVIAARPGHVGQALGVEIARKVEAGDEVLRVRLNPDQLGRVEVTLAFDDKGSLQATVRTESAHALELLRQDAPELARTLDQAGIRTDAQSFRFESRADSGGSNSQTASQQQQQGRGGQSHQQGRHEDLEPAPAYRAIRADGQVDLLA